MNHIMNTVNRTPPVELYHYSDFVGLNGLVANKQIWMGDLFFLNDEKEYQLGLDLFQESLAEQKAKYGNTPFGIFLNSIGSIEPLLREKPPFSFSLTEESDLLSQWRGYTKNGIGVSVGFNSQKLKGSFQLLPCLYSREEQKAYIDFLFDSAFNKFSLTPEQGKFDKSGCSNVAELPFWDAINEAGSIFISCLNVACSIIKHSSFQEEKEWRLVNFDRSNVEFLPKDTYLKPIKKVPIISEDLISSIKIGPNPNKHLCKSSICSLLKTYGMGAVDVTFSDIPYRN